MVRRPGTGSEFKELTFHVAFSIFWRPRNGLPLPRKVNDALKYHHVFLPVVTRSRSPVTECDFNFHKSNSTYLTDLDASRAHLSGLFFAPIFQKTTGSVRCNLIVSAVACTFRREIKPFQPYELWTKVASWDDKWIYMVPHFVDRSKFRPGCSVMQADTSSHKEKTTKRVPPEGDQTKHVFASAVTRMVFKRGRLTIPPERALETCGLLSVMTIESPTEASEMDAKIETTKLAADCPEWTRRELESYRETNIPIVRLERGWDAIHELFKGEETVLARYGDLMW
ncbi:unnamed protein product [Penicillium egyptiacum]|uniref:Thioesterase n=1 Tax=Penicillium egyptiacum TaxID=1303716 RepID=A0A9W4KKS9_9EURO|nr:unnamed protein product [Penicillium egyptiacum]